MSQGQLSELVGARRDRRSFGATQVCIKAGGAGGVGVGLNGPVHAVDFQRSLGGPGDADGPVELRSLAHFDAAEPEQGGQTRQPDQGHEHRDQHFQQGDAAAADVRAICARILRKRFISAASEAGRLLGILTSVLLRVPAMFSAVTTIPDWGPTATHIALL